MAAHMPVFEPCWVRARVRSGPNPLNLYPKHVCADVCCAFPLIPHSHTQIRAHTLTLPNSYCDFALKHTTTLPNSYYDLALNPDTT